MIEVATFRLRAGMAVDDFVAINAAYQTEFAYQQPGLRRRTVAPGLDGEWLVLTVWSSKADVHRAHEEAAHSRVAQDFENYVEPSSKSVAYYKELAG